MNQKLHNDVATDQHNPITRKQKLANELEQALEHPNSRQALVRLYSVLLEVDMRNNPDIYHKEA